MAKGGNFELEIARKLSLWFTDGKRDDLVCRTDTSGGRASVRTKNKKETNKYLFGDLKHSDDICKPMFDKWNIELKTGYGRKSKGKIILWDLLDYIDSRQKTPQISQFWNQCLYEADSSNRQPILIFRRNGRSACIVFRRIYYNQLNYIFGEARTFIEFNTENIFGISGTVSLIIMGFDSFLEWVSNPGMIFDKK